MIDTHAYSKRESWTTALHKY